MRTTCRADTAKRTVRRKTAKHGLLQPAGEELAAGGGPLALQRLREQLLRGRARRVRLRLPDAVEADAHVRPRLRVGKPPRDARQRPLQLLQSAHFDCRLHGTSGNVKNALDRRGGLWHNAARQKENRNGLRDGSESRERRNAGRLVFFRRNRTRSCRLLTRMSVMSYHIQGRRPRQPPLFFQSCRGCVFLDGRIFGRRL